jgi:hypothetical protein
MTPIDEPWDQAQHEPGWLDGYAWVEIGHSHHDTKAIHTLRGRLIAREDSNIHESLKAVIGAGLLAHIEARGKCYLYDWIDGAADAHFLIKEPFVE